ncbi:hypothetical protein HZB90_00410 [archaeon]|nr:hypothetical protein [archaeon]
MDEISNKTLATLLVVAIVISLAGAFFAMRGVSQITNVITGFESAGPGTAKVNISEVEEITLTQATVDFGTGYRNQSNVGINDECQLTTNQSPKPICWYNITAWAPSPFVLENTGNVYVNVTINSSINTTFLNGLPLGTAQQRYQFVPGDSSSGLFLRPENGCNVTFTVTGWTEFTNARQLICTNMSPTDTEDQFYVDINISIPAGVTGVKSTTVTFYGIRSAQ